MHHRCLPTSPGFCKARTSSMPTAGGHKMGIQSKHGPHESIPQCTILPPYFIDATLSTHHSKGCHQHNLRMLQEPFVLPFEVTATDRTAAMCISDHGHQLHHWGGQATTRFRHAGLPTCQLLSSCEHSRQCIHQGHRSMGPLAHTGRLSLPYLYTFNTVCGPACHCITRATSVNCRRRRTFGQHHASALPARHTPQT